MSPARRISRGKWVFHANGVQPTRDMQDWLVDTMSLTLKLTGRSRHFRVRRLHQGRKRCLADESAAVCLTRQRMVQEREVLLECDGVPMVYAHTIVPLRATVSDWPFFSRLGERSLGTTLFYDPVVWRGKLAYARLHASHPLVRRASAALGQPMDSPLFARRCLYRRRNGLLLCTEVFLPAIGSLNKTRKTETLRSHIANQLQSIE